MTTGSQGLPLLINDWIEKIYAIAYCYYRFRRQYFSDEISVVLLTGFSKNRDISNIHIYIARKASI